jgi:hypothetical protein
MTKVQHLGEQRRLEFNAEVFNVFNHPNLATLDASTSSIPMAAGSDRPDASLKRSQPLAKCSLQSSSSSDFAGIEESVFDHKVAL